MYLGLPDVSCSGSTPSSKEVTNAVPSAEALNERGLSTLPGSSSAGGSSYSAWAAAGALNRQRPQERWSRCPRHRLGRLAQREAGGGRSRGWLGGAAPAFREARGPGGRAYSGAQPPPRASARPRPWRGRRDALGPPSCAHPPRHTAAGGRLGPPPPAVGFGDPPARHPDTAAKDRGPKRAHRSRGRSFRHHHHRDLWHGSHTGREDHGHGVGNARRFPTKAHFASYCGTAPVEASSGEVVRHRLSLAGNRRLKVAPCTWSPSAKPDRTFGAGLIPILHNRGGYHRAAASRGGGNRSSASRTHSHPHNRLTRSGSAPSCRK